MSLKIAWSSECDHDILPMHKATAERVCMAVGAFAWDGTGTIERLDPDDDPDDPKAPFVILRARGGFALVKIVVSTETIEVHRLYSSTPQKRKVRLLEAVAPFRDPSDADD